jgi:hypothetical protein
MASLNELKAQVTKDLTIDQFNLLDKSLNVHVLYNKYLVKEYNAGVKLDQLQREEKAIERDIRIYYKDNYPERLDSKTLDFFVLSDEKMQEIGLRIANQKRYLKYLESICKSISQMSFNIKNYIEYMKYINGE